MAQQWYWMQDGQKKGPIGTAGLKEFARNGQLKPADMIWREGLSDWVPAAKAKGLFDGSQSGGLARAEPVAGGHSGLGTRQQPEAQASALDECAKAVATRDVAAEQRLKGVFRVRKFCLSAQYCGASSVVVFFVPVSTIVGLVGVILGIIGLIRLKTKAASVPFALEKTHLGQLALKAREDGHTQAVLGIVLGALGMMLSFGVTILPGIIRIWQVGRELDRITH